MPYLLYIISLLAPSAHGAAAVWYAVGTRSARVVARVAALIATVPSPSTTGTAALPTPQVRVWGIHLRIQIVGRWWGVPKCVRRGSLAIRVQRRATAANGCRCGHRRRRRRSWVGRASLQSSPGLATPRTCRRHSDHFSLGLRGRAPCSISSKRRHYFDFGVSCECGCCRSRHACRRRSVRLRLQSAHRGSRHAS